MTSCRTTYIWVLLGIRWKFVAEKERWALLNARSFLVFWMWNKKQKGENV